MTDDDITNLGKVLTGRQAGALREAIRALADRGNPLAFGARAGTDRLAPRARRVAQVLWLIYAHEVLYAMRCALAENLDRAGIKKRLGAPGWRAEASAAAIRELGLPSEVDDE